jgi:hypothetical protein
MTFNLRCDKPDAGNNACHVGRSAVATIVSQYAPDVIGTQAGKARRTMCDRL